MFKYYTNDAALMLMVFLTLAIIFHIEIEYNVDTLILVPMEIPIYANSYCLPCCYCSCNFNVDLNFV